MGDASAASLIVVAFLSRLRFSWPGLRGARGRPGIIWIPGRITGRGHRRPRLSRLKTLQSTSLGFKYPGGVCHEDA